MYQSTFVDSSSTARENDEQIGRREVDISTNNDSTTMEDHHYSLTAGSNTSRKSNGSDEVRVRLISRLIIIYDFTSTKHFIQIAKILQRRYLLWNTTG